LLTSLLEDLEKLVDIAKLHKSKKAKIQIPLVNFVIYLFQ
jgi:hypothetical protein